MECGLAKPVSLLQSDEAQRCPATFDELHKVLIEEIFRESRASYKKDVITFPAAWSSQASIVLEMSTLAHRQSQASADSLTAHVPSAVASVLSQAFPPNRTQFDCFD
ncbi:hypothetical protein SRHO_G00163290 [Serrasalmus rhombeus]